MMTTVRNGTLVTADLTYFARPFRSSVDPAGVVG
jgi:hypothetical protein